MPAGGIVIAALAVALAAAELPPGEQFTRPLGLPLVATTIEDAQRRLGSALVTVAGHHEQTVCYVDRPSRTFVAFMAQAEGLSGGFTVRRLGSEVPASCSQLPDWALARLASSVGGLRLGMLRKTFATVLVLGTRLKQVDGFETATFERSELLERRPGQTEADTLFTTIIVRGRFHEGRLVEYDVVKSSST